MVTEIPLAARPDLASNDELAMLILGIESEPEEWTRYGVLADKYDERGADLIAHAYRWMMRRQKRPHRRSHYSVRGQIRGFGTITQGRAVPTAFRWGWYSATSVVQKVSGIYPVTDPLSHSLPWMLLTGDQKLYATHHAAAQDLALWLMRLRDTYSADRPEGEDS